MRDARSHNLSLEADQLVTSKFIQGVLSLRLPRFEVAPFHLGFSVRDRALASPSAAQRKDRAPRLSPSCMCTPDCIFARAREVRRETAPVYTSFGGFKVVLSCFANQQSSSSQSKPCLIQQ